MSLDQSLFPSIGAVAQTTDDQTDALDESQEDDGDRPMQEIDSLCMTCHEQGRTRLLLTSIPYFREVVVISFRCEHCGASNNEIQSAGKIRPEGATYTAHIVARNDLDRQVVKSETCTINIPEIELTIPAARGQLTTVEGIIKDVVHDLSMDQALRRIQDEATYTKIQVIIDKLKKIVGDDDGDDSDTVGQAGEVKASKPSQIDAPFPPFTIKLDDPTGNSFIEFVGSISDPKWNMRTYHRSKEQNIELGLISSDVETDPSHTANEEDQDANAPGDDLEGENDEVYVFPGSCSSCGHPLNTYMKKVVIPYFKDVLIMSTNCDLCGYRDNEVKSGSAISDKGKKIILKVEDREDLSRDILKSETCGLSIPEIDLVLQDGTLGGRFTTLEGILDQIYEELSDKVFASGDSIIQGDDRRSAFETFLTNLKAVKNAERPFTLILDDPLANSYLQNLYAPDPDPNMEIVTYDRTWEQNEDLGLNDIKVEGYEEEGNDNTEQAVS